jgi:hypothetical protein
LDVSGVWTFTPMSPDLGINESGTSGTKLLQTPNGRDTDHSNAAAMLMLLGPATPKSFPAPPMRKRPHQCSTHSIGVLSSPTTCSSPMSVAAAHHRSNSFLPSSESFYNLVPNGNTRSCGTNVNSYHQRSVSAIADHRRTVSYIVDDGKTQIQHQRSLSSQQQQQQQQQQPIEGRRPPALPPKVGGSTSIYRPSETTATPTKIYDEPQSSNLPQFSFLQQLVQSSPNHPELLDTLRRHQVEPPQPRFNASRLTPKTVTRSPNVVTRSPSCAASLYTHQRAVSMLEPMTSYNETSPATQNSRFVKHIRSSSTLAPMPETPSSRRVIHQRSTSNGLTRVTSNVTPTRHSKTSQQILLHKSTSNLCPNPDGGKTSHHKRSSSTPYEGFVV